MCKYETDPASIVEDTVDTILSTDGQTDGQTDEQGETSIHRFNFVERGV